MKDFRWNKIYDGNLRKILNERDVKTGTFVTMFVRTLIASQHVIENDGTLWSILDKNNSMQSLKYVLSETTGGHSY